MVINVGNKSGGKKPPRLVPDVGHKRLMRHIPTIDSEDVERIIIRDYCNDSHEEARRILSRYGVESYQREVDRVRLATLKLASGDIDQLRHEVENACCDYRDTILAAEYPTCGRKMLKIDSLSKEELEKITGSDRDQYEKWLQK